MSDSKNDLQLSIEHQYSTKSAKQFLIDYLEQYDEIEKIFNSCNKLLQGYIDKVDTYWDTKAARVTELSENMSEEQLNDLVTQIILVTIQLTRPVDFTKVIGQLANSINVPSFDQEEKLRTVSEIIAVLCESDLYDIIPAKYAASGHLTIQSNYNISLDVIARLNSLMYLPPMIVKPKKIITNHSNAYITGADKNKGVILKPKNKHDYPLALDSINIFQSVALSIDEYTHDNIYEEPKDSLDTQDALDQFQAHIVEADKVYTLLRQSGNTFYFPFKYCKRGRTHQQGYHVNLQSYEYKRALLNLAYKEIIPLD